MKFSVNAAYEIERLIKYAESKKLISGFDVVAVRNSLMSLLEVTGVFSDSVPETDNVSDVLHKLLQYCYEKGILTDATVVKRELLASRIMGIVTPSPGTVIKNFNEAFAESPMEATDYLYNLSVDVEYIQKSKSERNFFWEGYQPYGRLEFTNNCQEHVETQEETAERLRTIKPAYPHCDMCVENMGFGGNLWVSAKHNLRMVPIKLLGENYFLQYSPIQYFGERFFVSKEKHAPLKTDIKTLQAMLNFVDNFPHFFICVDADLPYLGNKYSEHFSFQGGRHPMPIESAFIKTNFLNENFYGIRAGILYWPVSTVRLESASHETLSKAAAHICEAWRNYSDSSAKIQAKTGNARHNSFGIAARKNSQGYFEMDILLRNNKVSSIGKKAVFGHGAEYSNIKSAPLGVVDAMGLGVFESGFDADILRIISCLISGGYYKNKSKPELEKHERWITELLKKYGESADYSFWNDVIFHEASEKFAQMLELCGVFRMGTGDERFAEFMRGAGFYETSEKSASSILHSVASDKKSFAAVQAPAQETVSAQVPEAVTESIVHFNKVQSSDLFDSLGLDDDDNDNSTEGLFSVGGLTAEDMRELSDLSDVRELLSSTGEDFSESLEEIDDLSEFDDSMLEFFKKTSSSSEVLS